MCLGSHFWNEVRPQTFLEACPGRENKNPVPYGMRQDIEEVANRASAKYIACELGFETASSFIFVCGEAQTMEQSMLLLFFFFLYWGDYFVL